MRISDWSSDVCSSDLLAQHVMGLACAAPFREEELLAEIRSATPYSALTEEAFANVLHFIEGGGYALRAYDRFKRLTHDPDGTWRVSHPRFVQQHRLNAGIIVDQPRSEEHTSELQSLMRSSYDVFCLN